MGAGGRGAHRGSSVQGESRDVGGKSREKRDREGRRRERERERALAEPG